MAIFASTPSETVRGSAVNADAPTIFIGRGRYSCENSQNVPNSADGDNELRDLGEWHCFTYRVRGRRGRWEQILYTLGGRRLYRLALYRYDIIKGCGRVHVQSMQHVDAFHNEIGQNVKFSTKKYQAGVTYTELPTHPYCSDMALNLNENTIPE